jgi:hypothetical protein
MCVKLALKANMKRTSFSKDELTKASKLLDFVHSDACGLMKTISHGGAQYFVTFIDDFLKKNHVYFLKGKGVVFEKFKAYKVETQTDMKIKTL